MKARGKSPQIHENVWLAPNCTIAGDVVLGEQSTVWFGAIVIGMGAVVMDNVVVGAGAVVAAGAVVLQGTIIEKYTLYAGVPAKKRGEVKPELRKHLSKTADRYVEYSGWFKEDNK